MQLLHPDSIFNNGVHSIILDSFRYYYYYAIFSFAEDGRGEFGNLIYCGGKCGVSTKSLKNSSQFAHAYLTVNKTYKKVSQVHIIPYEMKTERKISIKILT